MKRFCVGVQWICIKIQRVGSILWSSFSLLYLIRKKKRLPLRTITYCHQRAVVWLGFSFVAHVTIFNRITCDTIANEKPGDFNTRAHHIKEHSFAKPNIEKNTHTFPLPFGIFQVIRVQNCIGAKRAQEFPVFVMFYLWHTLELNNQITQWSIYCILGIKHNFFSFGSLEISSANILTFSRMVRCVQH